MIESVHFENFKSLRDVELRGLQRLNVLVGPSGVGKTSVLQGLHLFTQLGVRRSDENGFSYHRPGRVFTDRWDAARLTTRGELGFTISCGGQLELAIRATLVPENDYPNFSVTLSGRTLELPGPSDEAARFFDDAAFHELGSSALLKFNLESLGGKSAAAKTSVPEIGSDGRGLATVLAYLAGAHRKNLESIEIQLGSILGTAVQIRMIPTSMVVDEREDIRVDHQVIPRIVHRPIPAHEFEVEFDNHGFIPSDLLSEGTLVTLGLLTVLHQPDCPRLLLLDDIDQGLHPMAQAKLIASLKGLLAERPEVQIIGTSHSPYLIDHLEPEEVQVMSFDTNGGGVAARLDSHPDWPKWKGTLQTGEFWSSVGESWVSGDSDEH